MPVALFSLSLSLYFFPFLLLLLLLLLFFLLLLFNWLSFAVVFINRPPDPAIRIVSGHGEERESNNKMRVAATICYIQAAT